LRVPYPGKGGEIAEKGELVNHSGRHEKTKKTPDLTRGSSNDIAHSSIIRDYTVFKLPTTEIRNSLLDPSIKYPGEGGGVPVIINMPLHSEGNQFHVWRILGSGDNGQRRGEKREYIKEEIAGRPFLGL